MDPVQLVVIESTVCSSVDQRAVVQHLKPVTNCVMTQQDNGLKHSSRSTTEQLKMENNQGVATIQSTDLKTTELLQQDLGRAVKKCLQTSMN